jgi:hypothetical protein
MKNPQEEPKLDRTCNNNCSDVCGECQIFEPKQETLEEAAEIILANNIDGLKDALKDDDLFYFYKGVIQCYGETMANWQAERMYSEEEVIAMLLIKHDGLSPEYVLQQFKKK